MFLWKSPIPLNLEHHITRINQEEMIRLQCEAREDHYRRERTIQRQMHELQTTNEELITTDKQLVEQISQLTEELEKLQAWHSC